MTVKKKEKKSNRNREKKVPVMKIGAHRKTEFA